MDIQLKRGLLDVCVLAAIKNEDSYGYKIIKDMKPYIELSESTLYTILKRLETSDMLTVRTAEYGGRLRKYYHITENVYYLIFSKFQIFRINWENDYAAGTQCRIRTILICHLTGYRADSHRLVHRAVFKCCR